MWLRCIASGVFCASVQANPLTDPPANPSPSAEAPQGVGVGGVEGVDRPEAAQRVVAYFDFEEPAIYATPRYWRRLATRPAEEDAESGPGFPSWNEPMLDIDAAAAFAGQGSVRLPTKGGSVGVRLDPGVVPVFPGAEYLVSAMVRTEGLRVASPGIVARYLDKSAQLIPSNEFAVFGNGRSHGTNGRHDKPGWTRLTLSVPGGPPDAAYLQLDLVLLQPDSPVAAEHHHEPHEMLETATLRQDLAGRARFDDVTIVQLPRVTLGVGSAGHCFVGNQTPELVLAVRDLTGEALECRITVQDAGGRVVDRVVRTLPSGTAREYWRPTLPAGERFGWFRATVDLLAAGSGQRVGSTYVDFCTLPQLTEITQLGAMQLADRDRFGVMVESTATPAGSLEELIDATGAGVAIIPAWSASLRTRDLPAHIKLLERLVAHVTAGRRSAWMSVTEPPDELSRKARESGSLDEALALPESDWGPLLTPLVDRFAAGVQRWVVGDPRRAPLWSVPTNERATEALATMLPGSAIMRVGPGEMDESPGRSPMVYAPPQSGAEGVGQVALALAQARSSLASDALGRTVAPALLVVAPGVDELALRGWRESAAVLARSMIEVWSAWSESSRLDAPTLVLTQPWRVDGPGTPRAMPTPLLAAWRHVASQLAGRRVAGRIDLAPGIEGIILRPLDPLRSGAIVAWRTTADPASALIDVDLGDGSVEVSDIFGNRKIARRGGPVVRMSPGGTSRADESHGEKVHKIWVPDEPIFIEGVDVPLARFVSGFRIEPPMLSMFQRDHQVELVLENPWPVRIDGRLRITEPGGISGGGQRDRGWVVSPRILAFALAPGEVARLPVQVAFSPSEEAGTKHVVADVELTAERVYDTFRIKAPMELGLDTIELSLDARLTPDPITGPDAEVRVQVTNRGKEQLSMELVAWASGYPRGKASASRVPPTGVVLRRFFFPDGAAKLQGQRVTVGVEDVQSRARITRSVVVE